MVINETLYTIMTAAVSIMLIILGILALESKKLISSVIYLSAMSLFAVLGFVLMKAPDVAITEAVIGSGLVTALFIFTLIGVTKLDKKDNQKAGDTK
ncbi:MAG: DUF4040 domain-containing protein [Vallitaleaceae bacterium]|jgi:energy-converting hydrogenase B subunit D|nr:DUF4040 domain-containing protein [Vallitaleaceae bacterium]